MQPMEQNCISRSEGVSPHSPPSATEKMENKKINTKITGCSTTKSITVYYLGWELRRKSAPRISPAEQNQNPVKRHSTMLRWVHRSDGTATENEEETEHRDQGHGLDGGDEGPHDVVHDRRVEKVLWRPTRREHRDAEAVGPDRRQVRGEEPRPTGDRNRRWEIEIQPPESRRRPPPRRHLSSNFSLSLSLSLSPLMILACSEGGGWEFIIY